MRKLERFLFGYSIVATTIFLITYGISSPKPLNIVSGILFLPLTLYFWLRLTNPEGTSSEKWSIRFVTVIVILSVLGIYAHQLINRYEPTANETILKSQLAEALKKNEELLKLTKTPSVSPTPSVSENPKETVADILLDQQAVETGGTRVALKTEVSTAFIYLEKSTESKKLGTLIPDVTYPFLEKDNLWYKVVATSEATGWVRKSDVDELK